MKLDLVPNQQPLRKQPSAALAIVMRSRDQVARDVLAVESGARGKINGADLALLRDRLHELNRTIAKHEREAVLAGLAAPGA